MLPLLFLQKHRGKNEWHLTFIAVVPTLRSHVGERLPITLPIASFLNGLQEFNLISSQHSSFEAFPSCLQSFHRRLLSLCPPQTGHLRKSLRFLPGFAVLLFFPC